MSFVLVQPSRGRIATAPVPTGRVCNRPVTTRPVTTRPVTTRPVTTRAVTTRAVTTRAVNRHGAAAVETALTLPLLLWCLFALLDLGLAATRSGALAEASRRMCRDAALRGADSPAATGIWGPDPFDASAADSSPFLDGIDGALPTMAPEDVSVSFRWPAGANQARDPVEVTVRYTHQALVPAIFPWGPFELNSTTTMPIIN